MENNVENKWYESVWFMLLMYIICPPIALLVVVCSKQKINKIYKAASLVILIIFIAWLGYMLSCWQ